MTQLTAERLHRTVNAETTTGALLPVLLVSGSAALVREVRCECKAA